jgi:glucosamine--fructose-6-phosphate aminotransferase (isomerizing)
VCGIAGLLSSESWDADIDLTWIDETVSQLEIVLRDESSLDSMERTLLDLTSKFDDLMSFGLHRRLIDGGHVLESVTCLIELLETSYRRVESVINEHGPSEDLERISEHVRDLTWQLEREVVGGAMRAKELMPAEAADIQVDKGVAFLAWTTEQVLGNLDRLEVRGRDSAGLSIQCLFHEGAARNSGDWPSLFGVPPGLDDVQNGVRRTVDALIHPDGSLVLTFVYKVANLVGRLGDNTAALRNRIRGDNALWEMAPGLSQISVISHTRWASNGIISLPNCHPTNGTLAGKEDVSTVGDRPALFVLNGDVDNYQELRLRLVEDRGFTIDPNVTTDAKILPIAFRLGTDHTKSLEDRFADLMNLCEGSLAVVMQHPLAPKSLFLAQKGSGQSLFVGKIREGLILASEVYGLAALTRTSYGLSGTEHGGTEVVLECRESDDFVFRGRYLEDREAFQPRRETIYIHSRDIFRDRYDYYFEKEIREAPSSVRKTIKGKYRKASGKIHFNTEGYDSFGILMGRLRDSALPQIRQVMVIGQGTASVAAMGVAYLVGKALARARIRANWSKASEMSGFVSDEPLDDTLLIAISQSGTTTDTNRTVDLAGSQGAWIHAIVNRRNSPLVEKAHSHFYTSDGRDVEMAVASTKAFYSQIAAGKLTALLLAQEFGSLTDEEIYQEIEELERLPADVQWVLDQSDHIRDVAETYGPSSRNWAVVGNGPNKIAADEIRIKLSELCYKSIPCDFTEDKKHIDLSTEPLTIVVANDLPEQIVQDTVKEVSIFKAHNGKPLVICSRGEQRFQGYAESMIMVPSTGAGLGFVPATVAGHLWGFYAAKAIDARAEILRNLRSMLTIALDDPSHWNPSGFRSTFSELMRMIGRGEMNAALPASTVAALSLYYESMGSYEWRELPSDALTEGIAILKTALEEVTRPIDTIRHQAKTVTVGISRPQELLTPILLRAIEKLCGRVEQIRESDMRMLRNLSPIISDVEGGLYYRVLPDTKGLPAACPSDSPYIQTVGRYGMCETKSSRYDEPNCAGGTKRTALRMRRAIWSSGRLGEESLLIVPLYPDRNSDCMGLLLFHVVFAEQASLQQKLGVLKGLGNRYYDVIERLEDSTQTYSLDDFLGSVSPRDLVLTPVENLVLGKMK